MQKWCKLYRNLNFVKLFCTMNTALFLKTHLYAWMKNTQLITEENRKQKYETLVWWENYGWLAFSHSSCVLTSVTVNKQTWTQHEASWCCCSCDIFSFNLCPPSCYMPALMSGSKFGEQTLECIELGCTVIWFQLRRAVPMKMSIREHMFLFKFELRYNLSPIGNMSIKV